MTIHLVEYLAHVLNCEISDLRYKPQIDLDYEISRIDAYDVSLSQWQDLAYFLTGKEIVFNSSNKAKAYILKEISKGS